MRRSRKNFHNNIRATPRFVLSDLSSSADLSGFRQTSPIPLVLAAASRPPEVLPNSGGLDSPASTRRSEAARGRRFVAIQAVSAAGHYQERFAALAERSQRVPRYLVAPASRAAPLSRREPPPKSLPGKLCCRARSVFDSHGYFFACVQHRKWRFEAGSDHAVYL
jgi:hypothetical protein